MIDPEGLVKLTPAYDLVSTHLVMEGDPLALPICGRDRKLQRSTWIKFAKYCGIGDKAACRVLDRQASVLAKAHQLIDHCYLPPAIKKENKWTCNATSQQPSISLLLAYDSTSKRTLRLPACGRTKPFEARFMEILVTTSHEDPQTACPCDCFP